MLERDFLKKSWACLNWLVLIYPFVTILSAYLPVSKPNVPRGMGAFPNTSLGRIVMQKTRLMWSLDPMWSEAPWRQGMSSTCHGKTELSRVSAKAKSSHAVFMSVLLHGLNCGRSQWNLSHLVTSCDGFSLDVINSMSFLEIFGWPNANSCNRTLR